MRQIARRMGKSGSVRLRARTHKARRPRGCARGSALRPRRPRLPRCSRSTRPPTGPTASATSSTARSARRSTRPTRPRGSDTINFGIGVGGPATIRPFSPLPQITDPVLIDGTTQPGYSGSPLIELDGVFLGPGAAGLSVPTSSSGIQGLAVNRFPGNGIELVGGGDHNVVTSNYVGVGLDGVAARGNGTGVAVLLGVEHDRRHGGRPSQRHLREHAVRHRADRRQAPTRSRATSSAPTRPATSPCRTSAGWPSVRTRTRSATHRADGTSSPGTATPECSSRAATTTSRATTSAPTRTRRSAVPNGFGGVYILGGATSASSNTFTANVISGNANFGALI